MALQETVDKEVTQSKKLCILHKWKLAKRFRFAFQVGSEYNTL